MFYYHGWSILDFVYIVYFCFTGNIVCHFVIKLACLSQQYLDQNAVYWAIVQWSVKGIQTIDNSFEVCHVTRKWTISSVKNNNRNEVYFQMVGFQEWLRITENKLECHLWLNLSRYKHHLYTFSSNERGVDFLFPCSDWLLNRQYLQ